MRMMMGVMMVVIAGAAADGVDRGRRRRQRWEVRMVCCSCRRRCRCRVMMMHRDRIGAGAATEATTGGRCCSRYCCGHCRHGWSTAAADASTTLTDAAAATRARRGIREGVQKGIVSFFNFDGFQGRTSGREINPTDSRTSP